MDHAALVREGDRHADLLEEGEEPQPREVARDVVSARADLPQDVGERAAAHELHGEEDLA